MSRGRVLFCGAGHDVIAALADGLRAHGWHVDLLTPPRPPDTLDGAWRTWHDAIPSVLPGASGLRRALRRLRRDVRVGDAASAWLATVESALSRGDYDVALAFLDLAPAPVGLARLVTRVHPRPMVVSLGGLAHEHRFGRGLYRAGLEATRWFVGRSARAPVHPDLFRPVPATRVPLAVFATRTWRDEALAVGLPADAARVIPFGVPVPSGPPPAPVPLRSPARLLWAGRLAPMKGLHLFLEALPRVRQRRPVTLTVLAAPGPSDYARQVHRQVHDLGLDDLVRFQLPVPLEALDAEFRRHDLLLFHSVYAEPVAQVLLRAALAGLPVAGPAAHAPDALLLEGVTASCYADTSAAAVSAAILRGLDDEAARAGRAERLATLVRRDHDLADTIAGYDRLLRERLAAAPAGT